MSNKVYDFLKWIVVLVLPAAAALYTTLAGAWNLPAQDQIVATITGIDAFLGAILQISSANYKKTQGNNSGE